MTTTPPAVVARAHEVHQSYGRSLALAGASVQVVEGERVAVTGRSGSGKSTLLLALAGVGDLAGQRPGELSGGEQQRVAIARALVTSPRLVLADEPTGALDTVTAEEVLDVMRTATAESGAALVVVTHDNRVAAALDREVVLRDGRVVSEEAAR